MVSERSWTQKKTRCMISLTCDMKIGKCMQSESRRVITRNRRQREGGIVSWVWSFSLGLPTILEMGIGSGCKTLWMHLILLASFHVLIRQLYIIFGEYLLKTFAHLLVCLYFLLLLEILTGKTAEKYPYSLLEGTMYYKPFSLWNFGRVVQTHSQPFLYAKFMGAIPESYLKRLRIFKKSSYSASLSLNNLSFYCSPGTFNHKQQEEIAFVQKFL